MTVLRSAIVLAGIALLWRLIVTISGAPPFILPPPETVALAMVEQAGPLARNAAITLLEIVLGLAIGVGLGALSALILAASRRARRWLMPLLIASQALPAFALAPLLVLWFGYGLGSKVAMAVLIIFFPVTSVLFDGLRRCDPGLSDLAQLAGARPAQSLFLIRLPAALPALGSGLKLAAVSAPIGAVVGEWVGASGGLGHMMLHANARLKIDQMFAALIVLAAMAALLYFAADWAAKRIAPWAHRSHLDEEARS